MARGGGLKLCAHGLTFYTSVLQTHHSSSTFNSTIRINLNVTYSFLRFHSLLYCCFFQRDVRFAYRQRPRPFLTHIFQFLLVRPRMRYISLGFYPGTHSFSRTIFLISSNIGHAASGPIILFIAPITPRLSPTITTVLPRCRPDSSLRANRVAYNSL